MELDRSIDSDGAVLLLAGIVRQAIADYRAGYTHPRIPDAATFLRAAGLLVGDGLDPRLKQRPHQKRRPNAAAYERSL